MSKQLKQFFSNEEFYSFDENLRIKNNDTDNPKLDALNDILEQIEQDFDSLFYENTVDIMLILYIYYRRIYILKLIETNNFQENVFEYLDYLNIKKDKDEQKQIENIPQQNVFAAIQKKYKKYFINNTKIHLNSCFS